MGNCFRSLCTSLVACWKYTIFGWILWPVQFSVSILSVFVIFTGPPISVVSNNIWAGCFMPTILFLVILFPSVVVNDGIGILSKVSFEMSGSVSLSTILLFSSFLLKGIWWSFCWYFSIPFCFFCGDIISLLMIMFAIFSKVNILCSGYAERSFLTLSI